MALRTMLRRVNGFLPPATSNRLKRTWKKLYFHYHASGASVDKSEVGRALRELGIGNGDNLFVHSSFDQMSSIRATPLELVEMLCDAVGQFGTVVMPTFPMTGTSQAYLEQNPVFHWQRTPSRAGILTEVFRRMPGTERSLHPTHSVAARGKMAQWLTHGHECSLTPFDECSPFYKLLEVDTLILRIGQLQAMTFRHLADHLIQDKIAYPIYTSDTTRTRLIGKDGSEYVIDTKTHNPAIECNHEVVIDQMTRQRYLKSATVGAVVFSLIRLKPYIQSYHRCQAEGLLRHYVTRTSLL